MNTVSKFIAVSCAAGIAAFSFAGTASADGWRHHHDHGDAVAAGIAGLAAGVIAGAIIASPPPPPRRYYYVPDDQPRVYYRSTYVRPVYRGGLEPWSRSWYRYCSDRYRSFDPRSGTYVGYDGEEHFCIAN